MKWWKIFINWIRKFFKMLLPTTADGKVDATKVVLAVVYNFNGKRVFRISIIEDGVSSEHWVEWSQQLENWLMCSGVNVTEDISLQQEFNFKLKIISNIPIEIANKAKIGMKK